VCERWKAEGDVTAGRSSRWYRDQGKQVETEGAGPGACTSFGRPCLGNRARTSMSTLWRQALPDR
jgi:hypothetical protein